MLEVIWLQQAESSSQEVPGVKSNRTRRDHMLKQFLKVTDLETWGKSDIRGGSNSNDRCITTFRSPFWFELTRGRGARWWIRTIVQNMTPLVAIRALNGRTVSKLMPMKFTIFTEEWLICKSWVSGCKSYVRWQRGDYAKRW